MISCHIGRAAMLLTLALAIGAGCQDRPRQAVTQPADQQKAAQPAQPASQPIPSQAPTEREPASPQAVRGPVDPAKPKPRPEARKPRKPKRPVDDWMIFREAFDPGLDATCIAKWTGGNRLEVHTENIKRITIDLAQLPDGAPDKGPWNLQIDGQGIEMTGFKPKPGYTGRIRDLIRSKNGIWTVDRKTLYRPRIGG